jgi:hypothetical protein
MCFARDLPMAISQFGYCAPSRRTSAEIRLEVSVPKYL